MCVRLLILNKIFVYFVQKTFILRYFLNKDRNKKANTNSPLPIVS
jgi:hypothetical protein